MSSLVPRTILRSARYRILTTKMSSSSTTTNQQQQQRFISHAKHPMPRDAWDGHMHVTDLARFPPAAKDKGKAGSKSGTATPPAEYEAQTSTVEGARENGERLGLPNMALTQVSTYGRDNSCLLWSLDQLGGAAGTARGVVDFDPATTTAETLAGWHARGVRGVRVNYKSVGAAPTAAEVAARLGALDEAIAPLGGKWAIHVHAALEAMPALRDALPSLRARLCIDHMGGPPRNFEPEELMQSEGWHALIDMLDNNNSREGSGGSGDDGKVRVFTKISAPYRYHADPARWPASFEAPVRQLLACADGGAVVFASDWPHTRFEDADVRPWRDLCLGWCGDSARLRERLFRDNARDLYDVE